MKETIRLGITGNIACGKSLVGKYLCGFGYPVLDCDEVVHRVLATCNTVSKKVAELCYPSNIIGSSKAGCFVNRKSLGDLLFASKTLKMEIEKILHPVVFQSICTFFGDQAKNQSKLSIVLIPLLFETRSEKLFDYTCLIYCDSIVQKERLRRRCIERNAELSEEEIELRIQSQTSQEEKRKLVDFIIDNSNSREASYIKIDEILRNLKHNESQQINE